MKNLVDRFQLSHKLWRNLLKKHWLAINLPLKQFSRGNEYQTPSLMWFIKPPPLYVVNLGRNEYQTPALIFGNSLEEMNIKQSNI
jgi:hypothetical protein